MRRLEKMAHESNVEGKKRRSVWLLTAMINPRTSPQSARGRHAPPPLKLRLKAGIAFPVRSSQPDCQCRRRGRSSRSRRRQRLVKRGCQTSFLLSNLLFNPSFLPTKQLLSRLANDGGAWKTNSTISAPLRPAGRETWLFTRRSSSLWRARSHSQYLIHQCYGTVLVG